MAISRIKGLLAFAVSLALLTVAAQASTIRIAQNDGSEHFNVATYINGFGAFGDPNYISSNLSSYDGLGDTAVIKVTMGNVVDYFRPVAGQTLLSMLTGHDRHLWSPTETGTYIAPVYFGPLHLGGSGSNWPRVFVPGDDRWFLSFWGSTDPIREGGCCAEVISPQTTPIWNRAFTVDLVTTMTPVPLPAGWPLLLVALSGLAVLRRTRAA